MKTLSYKVNDKFEPLFEVYREEKPLIIDGYEAVDLGEAGIWATCNIGANSPEEYGDYFAWGEVESKKNYTESNYKFGEDDFTKYNTTDGLNILEPEDDAAHVRMGGRWRMPTVNKFKKLYDLCNSEWTDDYEGTGIKGRIFILKTDESKKLFFPANGNYGSSVLNVGRSCNVWTSSKDFYYDYSSYSFMALLSGCNPLSKSLRYLGFSVRGFIPAEIDKEEEKPLVVNGYKAVDMGDAGIWAKYPLGVTDWNEDALNTILYFAWGETEGYTKSQIPNDKKFEWNYYKFTYSITKYNNTDNKTILDSEDDAVYLAMGNNWRIPTREEFDKLIRLCNNEEIINYNEIPGLNGRLFTLKTDSSKQLFFPAAGYCKNDSISSMGSNGFYWSSSRYTVGSARANCMYRGDIYQEDRYEGCCLLGILDSANELAQENS